MSDAIKLREFIKHLDQYLKELDESPDKELDSIDAYALGYLADDAGQTETCNKIDDLGDALESNSISNADYIREFHEIGKEYDV